MRRPPRALVLLAPLALACSSPPGPSIAVDAAVALDLAPSNAAVAARPYLFQIPVDYDPARAAPLVVVLHGFGFSGLIQARYLGLDRLVDGRGFLLAYPEGQLTAQGQQFWNASDAAGGDGGVGDDVSYLAAVIDDMSAHFHVDPHRVYLVGHSNGAFMAQYFACHRPDRVAAVVSLAGGMLVGVDCTAGAPVTLAEIHADTDDTILPSGGTILGMRYRPLADVMATWAKRDGCGATMDTSAPPLDLDNNVAGPETTIARWNDCAGADLELWTMHGGSHVPIPTRNFAATIYDWLAAHPRS